jgi:hypothetical protein
MLSPPNLFDAIYSEIKRAVNTLLTQHTQRTEYMIVWMHTAHSRNEAQSTHSFAKPEASDILNGQWWCDFFSSRVLLKYSDFRLPFGNARSKLNVSDNSVGPSRICIPTGYNLLKGLPCNFLF